MGNLDVKRIRIQVGGGRGTQWYDERIAGWRSFKLEDWVRFGLKMYDIYPMDSNWFTVDMNLEVVIS